MQSLEILVASEKTNSAHPRWGNLGNHAVDWSAVKRETFLLTFVKKQLIVFLMIDLLFVLFVLFSLVAVFVSNYRSEAPRPKWYRKFW